MWFPVCEFDWKIYRIRILFVMCCRVSFLGMHCSNIQSSSDLEFILERYKSHGLDPSNATFVTCGQWDLESMLPQQCLYSGKAFPPQDLECEIPCFFIHALIFPQTCHCLRCWMWAFLVSFLFICKHGKQTMYNVYFRWVCQHQADLSKYHWTVWKGRWPVFVVLFGCNWSDCLDPI